MRDVVSVEPRNSATLHVQSAGASVRSLWAQVALTMVCLLWAGMVLGISFLEGPVKFTAPTLTLPVGLDVGRQVFGVFNKVEIAWSLLGFALMWIVRPPRYIMWCLAIAWLIVALQTVWLRPILNARVDVILARQTPPA